MRFPIIFANLPHSFLNMRLARLRLMLRAMVPVIKNIRTLLISSTQLWGLFDTTLRLIYLRRKLIDCNFHFILSTCVRYGILPSNKTSYTLAQFQNAVLSQTGADPYFGCVSNGTVLTEVWYFNHVYGTVSPITLDRLNGIESAMTGAVWYVQANQLDNEFLLFRREAHMVLRTCSRVGA